MAAGLWESYLFIERRGEIFFFKKEMFKEEYNYQHCPTITFQLILREETWGPDRFSASFWFKVRETRIRLNADENEQ